MEVKALLHEVNNYIAYTNQLISEIPTTLAIFKISFTSLFFE